LVIALQNYENQPITATSRLWEPLVFFPKCHAAVDGSSYGTPNEDNALDDAETDYF
jgi:hypothetical protein